MTTPRCSATLEGENINFVIDTGACENIISSDVYHRVAKRINLLPSDKQLYGYGNHSKLNILGVFNALISVDDKSVRSDFYVFNGNARCLMSFDTACGLGLLSLSDSVIACVLPDDPNMIMKQFPEVFNGVGKLKGVKLKLHIDRDVSPIAQPVRRLPFGYRDKIKAKLQELVGNDIVEPISGIGTTWVSPLVCVLQDSGEIRQTVGMWLVKKAIVRERHPIPTTKEMLVGLQSAKVFSKLDLKQGFHQIVLDESCRDVTTFITPFGLFRYKRLTMGLNSAPEQFQYIIQTVLSGLEGVQNLADDIILYANNRAEHDKRLRALLTRLRDVGLTLNPRKCQLRLSSIRFLGYVISEEGVSPDPQKVDSIVKFSAPENVSDCRSFMGLVNFVGQFIPDLATVAEPIRRVTHKDVKFKWGKEQQQAFNKIKSLMSNAKALAHFDPEAKIVVVADASPFALGAVLYQKTVEGDRVVAYGHRSLSPVERRYSQTEREALALVFGCEHFMLYLLGNEFELITDHKPLETILNRPSSKPSPRLERWALRLQCFRYKVVYKSGKSNIADPLSRLCYDTASPGAMSHVMSVTEAHAVSVAQSAVPLAMTWDEIRKASKECEEVVHVIDSLKANSLSQCNAIYQSVKCELAECDGVLMRGDRIVVPVSLRGRALTLAHEGHQGLVKTKQRLRTKVWWPGIDKDCEKLCKTCLSCLKVSSPDPPMPLTMTKFPDKPWDYLSADILGPLPNGQYIFVIVDYHSRFFEAAFLKQVTADKIIDFLDVTFTRYGLPTVLRTDNGPQFIAKCFQDFLCENGIKWFSTTPLWPQANGEVERVNRTLLKSLKIAWGNGSPLHKELRKFLVAYRSTPHSTTGVAPFTLMFGRNMKTKLPEIGTEIDSKSLQQTAADNDSLVKLKAKQYTDHKHRERNDEIMIGEDVLLKQNKTNKLDSTFGDKRYTVISKHGSDIVCRDDSGGTVRRNITFAKRLPAQTNEGVEDALGMRDEQVGSQTEAQAQRKSPRQSCVPIRFGNYRVH